MRALHPCRSGGQILLIPREDIVPHPSQARKCFDIEALDGLAESIRQNGILQPIHVRQREDGRYEVIAGERRLRAAKLVGLAKLPCILMEANDERAAVYGLLENLQREELHYFETAQGIERLLTVFGMNVPTAAKRLGLDAAVVSEKLRLLRLKDDIRAEIRRLELSESDAQALLRLKDDAQMREVLREIAAQRRDSADLPWVYCPEAPRKAPIKIFKDVRLFVNTLDHAVDTMRKAGIEADAVTSETERYIEYVVHIPKGR